MSLYMMHSHYRDVHTHSHGLRSRNSYQKSPYQAGSVCYGNQIYIFKFYIRFTECRVDNRIYILQMMP